MGCVQWITFAEMQVVLLCLVPLYLQANDAHAHVFIHAGTNLLVSVGVVEVVRLVAMALLNRLYHKENLSTL